MFFRFIFIYVFYFLFFLNLGADIDGQEVKKGMLDKDGLPYIGRYMTNGSPYYRYFGINYFKKTLKNLIDKTRSFVKHLPCRHPNQIIEYLLFK